MKINANLRNRYSRQTMFYGLGEDGQAKLASSTAVIIGCGALGSNIANLLVRAGVGSIRIVDRDFIEYHNLQRQVLYDEDDIDACLPKAVAAERHLKKVNSSVKVTGIVADANFTNIERFCSGADVILDGLDNSEARFLINDVSLKHGIPWVYGGAVGSLGMTMTIVPGKSPCYKCVRPIIPGPGSPESPTCENTGIIGTVPAIVGALQATEAMKLMVGSQDVGHRLATIDVWEGKVNCIDIKSRDDCPACHGEYRSLETLFVVRAVSFCGQSRAVQVIDTRVKDFSLERLAERLKDRSVISQNEHMLRFTVGENEIVVFSDGRAIVRGTIDTELATSLYARFVTGSE